MKIILVCSFLIITFISNGQTRIIRYIPTVIGKYTIYSYEGSVNGVLGGEEKFEKGNRPVLEVSVNGRMKIISPQKSNIPFNISYWTINSFCVNNDITNVGNQYTWTAEVFAYPESTNKNVESVTILFSSEKHSITMLSVNNGNKIEVTLFTDSPNWWIGEAKK